jgi:hypothetical protein
MINSKGVEHYKVCSLTMVELREKLNKKITENSPNVWNLNDITSGSKKELHDPRKDF